MFVYENRIMLIIISTQTSFYAFKVRMKVADQRKTWFIEKKLAGCLPVFGNILPLHRVKRNAFKYCGNSSVGRARPCQGRGREFESRFPLILLD